ncbi:hypothetical protein RRF57_011131 [Xylaria bambusicola]|uniref:Uncharacterized protein n=1 Tax=Xylaria bambusicola TaxID=326684 RepID=A0AAN7V4A1_9PEZI
MPTEDGRLDGTCLSYLETCDSGPDFRYYSGEFMAEGNGDSFAGDGMLIYRAEIRPSEILM